MKLIQNKPLIICIKGSKMGTCISGVKGKITSEDELNDVKRSLDEYYTNKNMNRTREITNSMDVFKGLLWTVKSKYGAQYPSNAWSKYIEIYTSISDIIGHPVIPVCPNGIVNAFCNAELPGSSICALNHLFKCNIKTNDQMLSWIGSSYKPDNTGTQLGDSYGLYEKNKDNWLISDPDFDGNMTDVLTVKKCISLYRYKVPGGCNLYSHDAGLDVTKDIGPWKAYSDQERMNMKLHLGCAIVGLETLAPGGSFIAKQYTLYEKNTKDMIKIYAEFFEKFYLVKPMTSRPYNSESYFIGISYKRPENSEALLEQLYDLLGQDDLDIVSGHGTFKEPFGPKSTLFLDDIMDLVFRESAISSYMTISAGRQVKFLEETIKFLKEDRVWSSKEYFKEIQNWLKATKLCKISKEDWLPSN